jgi:hypothetical protein
MVGFNAEEAEPQRFAENVKKPLLGILCVLYINRSCSRVVRSPAQSLTNQLNERLKGHNHDECLPKMEKLRGIEKQQPQNCANLPTKKTKKHAANMTKLTNMTNMESLARRLRPEFCHSERSQLVPQGRSGDLRNLVRPLFGYPNLLVFQRRSLWSWNSHRDDRVSWNSHRDDRVSWNSHRDDRVSWNSHRDDIDTCPREAPIKMPEEPIIED